MLCYGVPWFVADGGIHVHVEPYDLIKSDYE